MHYLYTTLLIACFLISCQSKAQVNNNVKKITKTDHEWQQQLDSLSFYVLRKKGTEPAFSGKYDAFYKKGIYTCKACDTPLFKSKNKFNSGTGWPSFDQAIQPNVAYSKDFDLGIPRTEIHCNVCDGHLGHVFDDGPQNTTGKRYCVNSVSLQFRPKK